MSESVFPKDFLWGAATASAQIEGGWNEDGRTSKASGMWHPVIRSKAVQTAILPATIIIAGGRTWRL